MNRILSRLSDTCCMAVTMIVFLLCPFSVVQAQVLDHLQVSWVSQSPAWFTGYRFTNDDYRSPDNSVTSGSQLPTYLAHLASSFAATSSVPVEIRFDTQHPQNAYRLRRTGPPGTTYQIQEVNPYVAVPFSAWDVTNPSSPRQLTVAWRDQIDDGIWNPSLGNDNGEIVFIYYKSYDPTGTTQFSMPPGAIGDETTVGEKADIMYGLSIQVLPGHSLNESAGTLTITPSYYMPATIAVKPGSDQGSVNCQNPKEVIPVAILSTSTFDVAQVNQSTVVFGWANAPEIHGTAHVQDVDGDGNNDLLFHFLYRQTGIMCEETEATLFGFLNSGMPFRGTSAIHFITPGPTFKGATGIHDGNDVVLTVAPNGHLATDGVSYAEGYYPKKTQNQYIYDAGPWVGGIVNGVRTVAESQYLSEFVPSEIGSTGRPFRVFSSSSITDRKSWPLEFSTASGEPVIVPKAHNLVTQYNDLHGVPAREVQTPLGIEIRQRSLAYGDAAKRSALIVLWEIKNISSTPIQDAYFGFWSDPDIGDAGDDRTSTYNDMSITWDQNFFESAFTEKPAVFAFDFLETPGNLGVRNYTAFTNGPPNSDSHSDFGQYQFLSGAWHFETNWWGDVRSLLSTGPFNLDPGQTALVAGALLFAQIPLAAGAIWTDQAFPFRPMPGQSQLSALLQLQNEVRAFYDMNLKGKGFQKEAMKDEGTAIEILPDRFVLFQNYPNPFNPSTTIRYGLPHKSSVQLTVINSLGQQVALLVEGEKEAGYHDIRFDGSGLASGVYFYRLTAGNFIQTNKLLLLR